MIPQLVGGWVDWLEIIKAGFLSGAKAGGEGAIPHVFQ
jgi:hypothetical protein